MKAFINRFLAVFLSLFLIVAPTIQQANAASSWSITGAISAGSRTIVSATKGGYKSAVNIAPSAGRLGVKLIKIGRSGAMIYAVSQILGDGVSWVLDPANNAVKYKKKTDFACRDRWNSSTKFPPAPIATTAANICGSKGISNMYENGENVTVVSCKGGYTIHLLCDVQEVDAYLPIEQVAARVIANARSGHAPSQAATRETATEMVVAGDFDADLMSGAVPTSDSRPLIPAVPGNGNGNVTHGSDVGIGEDGMSGATPGQMGDAAKDAADASKRAADAAKDAAKAAQDAAREAADAAADLVNSGADTAAIDAANDRAAAAEKAAAEAKSQAERAVQAANDRAAAAERAAQAATAAAQAAAAQAAADAAAAQAAADAAAAADKAAAQAAADRAAAAAAQAARELAAAKAKQEAAEKAAEKAKAEAAKPMEFELPAFCTWAAIVCETAEWLKREPETPEITAIDTDSPIDDFDSDKSYITFTGSCPPKYTASLSIMGATAPFEFDYAPICTVMSYLKPFIVGAGYIAAAYIIAGHSRGSKD